ncbi:MAG: putative nucleotidyltransferase substrate binding domain-containing protein [Burkholderiales bacterium]
MTVAPDASVREAAERMRAERVSSALIVERERLVGIVTDRDLRDRVVATGLDIGVPVGRIATPDPHTVDVRTTGFDALLLMARKNVHHVPVLDGTAVAGMITTTDVSKHASTSAVFLASEIYRQDDVEGLKRVSARTRDLQCNLAAADATAYATGQVISAITDALTTRLLQLAEARLGPPPVAYAWVAAGSQARSEQTARSDQDNCMVLADDYDEREHGAYYDALSREVCAGLDACGYIYCPGEMMAMTDTWRQPQAQWRRYFHKWIDTPEPKALMLTSVFFDLRRIHGDAALLDDLRRETLASTRKSGIFLAHLARLALERRPPLSLFGRISTARSGPHRGTVDLKMHAITPIVDLARIFALAAGLPAVNTRHRLEAAVEGGELSEQGSRDLRDALEFISSQRIRHQVRQMAADQAPDNFLLPDELSQFERTQLKDAFKIVAEIQNAVGQRYQVASF